MTDEERIAGELTEQFPCLAGAVSVKRARRVFAEVPAEYFFVVYEHVVRRMGFNTLCTITGMDEGALFKVLYHLTRDNRTVLTLKRAVDKQKPVIGTVTADFPQADIYEREIKDLLGIEIEGLAPGQRYPLPDKYPAGSYPLRKDWTPTVFPDKEVGRG